MNTKECPRGPLEPVVRRLRDHLECGGGGCKGCRNSGTEMALTSRPVLTMPADPDAFEDARETCPCYEGVSINEGVNQCMHADAAGEWCDVETCPLVPPNTTNEPPAVGSITELG